jgi:hypothetical protein
VRSDDDDDGTDAYWNEVVVPQIRADRAAREAAVAGREPLVREVEAILFEHDPIRISSGTNADEYEGEAQSIVVRLPEAGSESEVQRIVHEEFVTWFGPESQIHKTIGGAT